MKKNTSIMNKKMSDLTLGETLKVSFWATIISILLGLLPFGIAAVMEGRDNKKALRSAPAYDEEEEETSD